MTLSLKTKSAYAFWVLWGLFFAGGDDVDGGVAHLFVAAAALAEPLLEVFALECSGQFHCAVLSES